jgi:hypothetical protein
MQFYIVHALIVVPPPLLFCSPGIGQFRVAVVTVLLGSCQIRRGSVQQDTIPRILQNAQQRYTLVSGAVLGKSNRSYCTHTVSVSVTESLRMLNKYRSHCTSIGCVTAAIVFTVLICILSNFHLMESWIFDQLLSRFL